MIGGLQGEEWKFIQKYLKENRREKRKTKRALYISPRGKISLSVKYTIYVSRDDFHPSYSLYKAKPVLASYKDKKGIYIKKIKKKRSKVELAEQRRIRTTHGLV